MNLFTKITRPIEIKIPICYSKEDLIKYQDDWVHGDFITASKYSFIRYKEKQEAYKYAVNWWLRNMSFIDFLIYNFLSFLTPYKLKTTSL